MSCIECAGIQVHILCKWEMSLFSNEREKSDDLLVALKRSMSSPADYVGESDLIPGCFLWSPHPTGAKLSGAVDSRSSLITFVWKRWASLQFEIEFHHHRCISWEQPSVVFLVKSLWSTLEGAPGLPHSSYATLSQTPQSLNMRRNRRHSG